MLKGFSSESDWKYIIMKAFASTVFYITCFLYYRETKWGFFSNHDSLSVKMEPRYLENILLKPGN